jgi:hypothetical protein
VRVFFWLDPSSLEKYALCLDHLFCREATAVSALQDTFGKAFEV